MKPQVLTIKDTAIDSVTITYMFEAKWELLCLLSVTFTYTFEAKWRLLCLLSVTFTHV